MLRMTIQQFKGVPWQHHRTGPWPPTIRMANLNRASPYQARISPSLLIPEGAQGEASCYKKAKDSLQSLRFFLEICLPRRHSSPGSTAMKWFRSKVHRGAPIILQWPGPSHSPRHMLCISAKLPNLNLHSRIPFLCWEMCINVRDLIHIRTLVMIVGKRQGRGRDRYVYHFRNWTGQLTNSSGQGSSTCQPFKMPILWISLFPSRLRSPSRKNRLQPSAAKVDMSTVWKE